MSEREDAEMRSLGNYMLAGIDPAGVRSLTTDEAVRLAKIGADEPEALSADEVRALALWCAKGGLVRN